MSINGNILSKIFCTLKQQWGRATFGGFFRFSQLTPPKFPSVLQTKKLAKIAGTHAIPKGQFAIFPAIALVASSDPDDLFADTDLEDNIAHLMILARLALEKGDMERAEGILQMGIKICEDHKINFGLPQIYDILATIALAEGEIEKAESIMVTVIEKLIQSGLDEDDHYIVDFKLRLARIYSGYRDNDLAEIGFKTCLQTQKNKILNGDVSTRTSMLYINVLFWYGVHMIRNERYTSAKGMLDKAYDFSHQIKGLSPYQEMVILYTLSDLNMELGEYDSALSKMQTAVMLGKGISSVDLPRCYVKLAKIYLTMGVHDQARAAADEGAKLARMFNKGDVLLDAQIILEEIDLIKN